MTNKLKKRARALAAERGISYQAAVNALRTDRAADPSEESITPAAPSPLDFYARIQPAAPSPATPALFVVEYNVAGFDGKQFDKKHRAGPYSAAEVHSHLRDIEGYEGVSNARIVPVESVS